MGTGELSESWGSTSRRKERKRKEREGLEKYGEEGRTEMRDSG